MGEALKWPVGLEREPLHAKGFYAVLAGAVLIGLAMDFSLINPIKTLYWTAVINGVVAGPVMITMMLMASNRKVMGQFSPVGTTAFSPVFQGSSRWGGRSPNPPESRSGTSGGMPG